MYWVWFGPISLQSRQRKATRAPIRGLTDTLWFLITIREDFISEYLTLKSLFPFSHLDSSEDCLIDVRFDWVKLSKLHRYTLRHVSHIWKIILKFQEFLF